MELIKYTEEKSKKVVPCEISAMVFDYKNMVNRRYNPLDILIINYLSGVVYATEKMIYDMCLTSGYDEYMIDRTVSNNISRLIGTGAVMKYSYGADRNIVDDMGVVKTIFEGEWCFYGLSLECRAYLSNKRKLGKAQLEPTASEVIRLLPLSAIAAKCDIESRAVYFNNGDISYLKSVWNGKTLYSHVYRNGDGNLRQSIACLMRKVRSDIANRAVIIVCSDLDEVNKNAVLLLEELDMKELFGVYFTYDSALLMSKNLQLYHVCRDGNDIIVKLV